MARIVITNRIPQSAVDLLRAEHDVDAWEQEETIPRAECLRRIAGADAVVTLLTDRVDDEFLDAAGEQLQVVANVAVGYNNIDVAACERHGVIATNTPGVLTDATADTAFGLMLMATRRFGEGERIIRARTPWQWGMFYLLGMGLRGKTLGIVGAGEIASRWRDAPRPSAWTSSMRAPATWPPMQRPGSTRGVSSSRRSSPPRTSCRCTARSSPQAGPGRRITSSTPTRCAP